MNAANMLLFAGLCGGMIGVAVFLFGWRGKRINDHPVCRKCRYDLSGIPNESERCSECGGVITGRRGVRMGVRRRRRWVISFGVVLFLISGSLVGLSFWPRARGINLNLYKTSWWLVLDSSSGDARTVDGAMRVLVDRYERGDLSPERVDDLVERGLSLQADEDVPWLPVWGNLIEDAWRKGRLTDEQKLAYSQGAAEFKIIARGKIKAGIDQNINIEVHGKRCGTDSNRLPPYQSSSGGSGPGSAFGFIVRVRELAVGGVSVLDKPYSWYPAVDMNGWSSAGIAIHQVPPVGDYVITARIVLRGDGDVWKTLGGMQADGSLPDSPTMGPSFEIVLSRKVEVVSADTELVRGIADPLKKDAISKCIIVQGAKIDSQGMFSCSVQFDHSPTGLAFDIFLRDDTGREWKVGSAINTLVGGVMGTGLAGFNVPGFTGSRGDLIFHSSRQVAESISEMTEFWEGEIIIKGVAVMREAGDSHANGDGGE